MRLIPVALALFWGLNWPAVKIVLSICPPFTLRLLGLGSGALLLLALARMKRLALLPPRASWPGIVVGGILAVAPGKASIAVWSPGLNKVGNSALGSAALEMLATRTGWSVFGT